MRVKNTHLYLKISLVVLFFQTALCYEKISSPLKNINNANYSLYIYDLKNNKDIIKENENKMLIPASIEKLVTAYSALSKLGSDFKFITTTYYSGKILGNKLDGNLYINFSGDPTLTSNDIKSILRMSNIKTITGDIILVSSKFDKINYGPGWMWDELDDCYATPLESSIINGNCVTALIWPADKVNKPANLKLEKQLDQPLYSEVITKQNDYNCEFKFKRYSFLNYNLTGCINIESNIQKLKIAAHNANNFAKITVAQIIKEENIGLKGSITTTSKNNIKSIKLNDHHSQPLSDIIVTMIKNSDNLIAESIFKTLGAIDSKQPGSWDNGHEAVIKELNKNHFYLDASQAVDGSGLSRYNLLSANQIMDLLQRIKKNNIISRTIEKSLPISGIDGTLNWINTKELIGSINAKTGSMSGVYNVAGYFSTKKSDYAFVIMINGINHQAKQYHSVIEKTLANAVIEL
jgi:D-alanyl-D-alanine carboxypeptidase/D-alanyl-D-alanine-endopeptidase (penicillin-binding protein 4)